MRLRRLVGVVLAATSLMITNANAASVSLPDLRDPAAAVDPLLRDAQTYAKTSGLPVSVVYRQLQIQGAVGQLQEQVAKQWPDTFGGLWIDQPTGLVHVAFTKDAAANVASLDRSFSQPAILRPVTVARSYAELERVQRHMLADQRRAVRFPGLKGARYNLDIDVTQNQPVVVTDGHTAETVRAFGARYGDLRVEATGTGEPHTCIATDCRHYLRSGLAGDICCWARECSLAFTVSTGQVNLETLTAGHCASNYYLYHGNEQFGHVHDSQNSGTADAAVYYVDASDFKAGPWIFVDPFETTRAVTSMQTYAALTVGQVICKSGVRTGYTCGSVLSKNYSADGLTNLMETNMCDDSGDSGAGIFIGGQAVGIIHGGNANGCPSGYRGWHTHIQNAVNNLVSGLLVSTSTSAPFFSQITATGVPTQISTGSTIVAKFSKPVRCFTVNPSDFTVRVQNQSGVYSVTSLTCSGDSNATVQLTTSRPLVRGTSVSVAISSGTIQDPGGQGVGASTRTATVG